MKVFLHLILRRNIVQDKNHPFIENIILLHP